MEQAGLAGIAATVIVIMRILIAVVFIRAGTIKLADLKEFRLAIANYQILPRRLVTTAGISVPVVEGMAGILLLLGVLPVVVSALLAALLVSFSAAIAINLARGRVFDCGCGGNTAPRLIGWRHVAVNLLLAASAATISIAPPAGLGLLHGPDGLFSIRVPNGSIVPIILATVLALMSARVTGAAAAAYRLIRHSR